MRQLLNVCSTGRLILCGRLVFLVAAGGLWLMPLFWTGWTGKRLWHLPAGIRYQYHVAALFTQRALYWSDYHLEFQDLSGTWHELPEAMVFPMSALGSRTRYDRLMSGLARQKTVTQKVLHGRLVSHILQSLQRSAGLGVIQQIHGLRLVRSKWVVGSPEMRMTSGAWQRPLSTTIPKSQRTVLASYRISNGRVMTGETAGKTRLSTSAPPKQAVRESDAEKRPAESSRQVPPLTPGTISRSSGLRDRLTPPLPDMPRGLPGRETPSEKKPDRQKGVSTP